MGTLSKIATIAAVALFIWFTVVWTKQGFKKSILPLVLSVAVMLLAVCLKTEDSEMISRMIIAFPSVCMIIGGIIFILGGSNAQERINGLKIFFVSILLFAMLTLFGVNFSWSSKPNNDYDDVWDKNPNTWSDEEEEYVNDFFEWQQDYYE